MSEETTILLTQEGMERLRKELKELSSNEKPDLLRRLAEARAHGDLSENAEYHAVKERKAEVEKRMHELNSILSRAEVYHPKEEEANGACVFGSFISVRIDRGDDKKAEREFRVVSKHEADTKSGRLSIASPLGRELIGKTEGDFVELETPSGTIVYEILSISYQA